MDQAGSADPLTTARSPKLETLFPRLDDVLVPRAGAAARSDAGVVTP